MSSSLLFAFRFSLFLFLPLTASAAPPVVSAVDSISITVSDLDKAVDFYTTVLSFEKLSEEEVLGPEWESMTGVFGCRLRIAELKLGDEHIQLIDYLTPRSRPIPDDARANDQSFQHLAIVVSDMDHAHELLRAHHVEYASTAPQTLPLSNPGAGGIKAFYFRDPDGHFLELISFPSGKGDPRWQRPTDRLFLGIDHTAIVVESTERSLAWYRDVLGLTIAGTSMNQGPEQAHLNNVENAQLRITALRAKNGPGVELLEYITPAETRPAPADATPTDLAHWCINFRLETPSATAMIQSAAAETGLAKLQSRDIPHTPPGEPFPQPTRIFKDPDGHSISFTSSGG